MTAFARSVTQHMPDGTFTTDRYNNKKPNFTDVKRTPIAQYPGNSQETDTAATDQVLADMVILLDPSITATAADEWTLSDGNRYKAAGGPRSYFNPQTGFAVTQVNLRRIS